MLKLHGQEAVGEDTLSSEELDCQICYSPYDLGSCRPKVLECCHRLCSRCLGRMVDLGEAPADVLACPFCRRVTRLPGEAVRNLPDDNSLLEALRSKTQRSVQQDAELLLSPRRLSSLLHPSSTPYSTIRSSPNFVVITIMEPPPPPSARAASSSSSSLDSLTSLSLRRSPWSRAALLCQSGARALLWLLGLLYFASLPLGVYMLIMQRTTLGALLVSLLPASLFLVILLGFCQCVCYELWRCVPPERGPRPGQAWS